MHPLALIIGLSATAFLFKAKKSTEDIEEGEHFGIVFNFPSAVADEEESAEEVRQALKDRGLLVEEILGLAANDGSRPQRTYLAGGHHGTGSIRVGDKLADANVTAIWRASNQAALADKIRGLKLYKVLG